MYLATMGVAVKSILEHPHFDRSEFSERWKKARIAGIFSILARLQADGESEFDLLKAARDVEPKEQDLILRGVFDNSRKLGLGATRYFGVTWEISDIVELLPFASSPCFSQVWRECDQVQVLRRAGCGVFGQLGRFGCDYWREAVDGLVMGVGDGERFSRHSSLGHGDVECVDVLYVENPLPEFAVSDRGKRGIQRSGRKFGRLPDELLQRLEPIRKRYESTGLRLALEGLSEGTLFYRLESGDGSICGAGGKLLHESFAREVSRVSPALRIKDVGPLAVLGGSK